MVFRIEVYCYTCCLAACASMKSCPFSRLRDRGGGCCIACSCSEILACLALLTSDGLFCISGARRTPAELMGLKREDNFFDAVVKVLSKLLIFFLDVFRFLGILFAPTNSLRLLPPSLPLFRVLPTSAVCRGYIRMKSFKTWY